MTTLGLALEGPADWFAERRSAAEAEAALWALPATLTQLEVDLPSLSPYGCTVKVRPIIDAIIIDSCSLARWIASAAVHGLL